MKLLFYKGLLGVATLLLVLSFEMLSKSNPNNLDMEKCVDEHVENAYPIICGNVLEKSMEVMGLDMGMLPPIAWSAERDTSGTVTIKQKLSQGGLVIVQWSSATLDTFQVYNSNTTLVNYSLQLTGNGPFTINVRACENDIEEIDVQYQSLTAMDVSMLTGLKKFYARDNMLRGILDFRLATELDACHIYHNNYGSNSGSWTLKILLDKVRDLHIYRSKITDTLDLSTCSNLANVQIFENEISNLILPLSSTAPNLHTVYAYNNLIEDTIIFSGFPNLALIRIETNNVEYAKVDNLPKLTYFNANSNRLRDTLDFRASDSLDVCYAAQNNYGTGADTGSWTLKILLDKVRDLHIYRSKITDTLDLSTCTNLQNIHARENNITGIILPPAPNANPSGPKIPIKIASVHTNNMSAVALDNFLTSLYGHVKASSPTYNGTLATVNNTFPYLSNAQGILDTLALAAPPSGNGYGWTVTQ